MKENKQLLTLANIYAPGKDNPTFLSNFFHHLADFKRENIVIGNDSNLALDLERVLHIKIR